MESKKPTFRIQYPKKLEFFYTQKSRFKVAFGGRGAGKSQNVAQALLIKAMEKPRLILCARMFQNTIADSVHSLLKRIINENKWDGYFKVTDDKITCINGSKFIFKGLARNYNEIKSFEGVDYCWTEESESITEEAWDVLLPTIRKPESEIWVTFNPAWKKDATYQRFVENKPDDCLSVLINYYDNPWFTEANRAEMLFDKKTNRSRYEHKWLGKPNVEGANLIKLSKFNRYKYPPESFPFVFICCDTAFSEKKKADGSAFMLAGVIDHKVYFLDGYWKQVTFPDLRRDLLSFYKKAKSKYSNLSGVYIENKGSGISLIQQLREEGMPIMELQPTVTNKELKKEQISDKYTRFLEIEADIDSGLCYIPESADWLLEFEKQAEAFTGGKQDEKDDFCFVAGTRIKTLWGDKKIEDIKVGDYVVTPFGLRRVEVATCTGEKEVIHNIGLTGTPEHKVLTYKNGYSKLCEVKTRKECIVWNLKNLLIYPIKSMLYLTDKNIAEWGERESISYLIRHELQKEKIRKDFTLRFGNMRTGEKFRKVTSFITKTLIHSTITLTIWSVCQLANTMRNITKGVLKEDTAKSNVNIYQKSESLQKNGTLPKKAENGTNSTQKQLWTQRKKQEFAKNAEKNLFTETHHGIKKMFMTEGGVKDVTEGIGFGYTESCKGEKLPVYNLKVNGGVYFANDILVSNCDALMYSLKVARKGIEIDWSKVNAEFF